MKVPPFHWSKPPGKNYPMGRQTPAGKQVQNPGIGEMSWNHVISTVLFFRGWCSELVSFQWYSMLTSKMGYLHPSWNTDQGVKQTRKGEDIRCQYFSRTEREPARAYGVHTNECPTPSGTLRSLRLSVPVWTRKVVNYAWTRWSPGKPRWRPVAMLTCKSLVWFGYRSERLIEPPSSWFTSKFPSG